MGSTMNKNPLTKGILTENAVGIGTVTAEMVEERANELAAIALASRSRRENRGRE